MGFRTNLVEVTNKHCKSWVEEYLKEKEDNTSNYQVEVSPHIKPDNIGGIHKGIANVDTCEYGTRHPRSAEESPGIENPQCLPDINESPDYKGETSRCYLQGYKSNVTI